MAKPIRDNTPAAAAAAAAVADALTPGAPIPGAAAAPPATATEILDQAHQVERETMLAPSREDRLTDADTALAIAADAVGARPKGYILIVCTAPGFRRAGLIHPAKAEYPRDFFTPEQLDMIEDEPLLEMVSIGGEPIARTEAPHGYPVTTIDPVAARKAAADAVGRGPNRAGYGRRNAAGDRTRF